MPTDECSKDFTPRMISECRVCGGSLEDLLHFDNFAMTGIFPKPDEEVPRGDMDLVRCRACELIQLKQTYPLELMYGDNYGYRTGLNNSMVLHMHWLTRWVRETVEPGLTDYLLDIGSNDGTLLGTYPRGVIVGMDPTAKKFEKHLPPCGHFLPEFFSAESYLGKGFGKARIVTSIAMFYDLDDPLKFMRDVYDVMTDDGVWLMEQAYVGKMLDNCGYDTICQEHLTYYSIRDIHMMAREVGFVITDFTHTTTNGGSVAFKLRKRGRTDPRLAQELYDEERTLRERTERFLRDVEKHPAELAKVVGKCDSVVGIGASTKGNVILQYCPEVAKRVRAIADVNKDKYGCVTPGTKIVICSDGDVEAFNPTHYLVLPWHFRAGMIKRYKGKKLIFPLPYVEVVDAA